MYILTYGSEEKVKKYISTNLIMENSLLEKLKIGGGKYSEDIFGCVKICRMSVDDDSDGTPKGMYVTAFMPCMWEMSEYDTEECVSALAGELRDVIEKKLQRKISERDIFLVAGMGNRRISSDSVGALTLEKINVTRHVDVVSPNTLSRVGLCSLCTLECGVLGETGVRTAELLEGLVGVVKPTCIIAVDALAARSADRLGRTVQISDAGIAPGAGIGNRQSEISEKTLGVPVVAVGVPTVVSAATLVADALDGKGIAKLDDALEGRLNACKNFFVAPKECDLLSHSAAKIISKAVNIMLGVDGNIL